MIFFFFFFFAVDISNVFVYLQPKQMIVENEKHVDNQALSIYLLSNNEINSLAFF
jgi:hypothetical protein